MDILSSLGQEAFESDQEGSSNQTNRSGKLSNILWAKPLQDLEAYTNSMCID